MNDTIDNACKAFYESFFTGMPSNLWADLPESMRVKYHDNMRAAIAALREPTPEMIHAAEMTGLIGGDRGSFRHAVIVYTAMIDALLAETEKTDG